MHRIMILACCVLACKAASLPLGQQPTGSSSQDWAICNVAGQQLKPGQRATQGSFVFECQLTGDMVRTTIVACLDDGESGSRREHAIEDTWETGTAPYRYVYQCAKTETGAARKVAKCLYESAGNKVYLSPNSEQKVGNNTIRCDQMGENGLQYHITYGQTTAGSSSSSGTNTNTGSTNTGSNTNTNTNTGSNTNTNTNTGSNTNTNTGSNANTNTGSTLISAGSSFMTDTSGPSFSNQQGPGSEPVVCYVNGREYKPGQRTNERGWVYECQVGSDGVASATIVGCLDDGENGQTPREHAVGQTWEVGKKPYRFVYECIKSGKLTASKNVAKCLYDGDEGRFEIQPNEEKVVGNKRVKCVSLGGVSGLRYNIVQTDSGSASASASTNTNSKSNSNTNSGSSVNTRNADVADTVNAGSSSSSTVQRSEPAPSSSTNRQEPTCTSSGKELKIGQRTTSGSFVYECQRVNDNMVRNAIVACLDDNKPQGEHPHGTQWVEGDKPFRYVFECAKNGDETQKKAVQCSYEPEDQPGAVKLGLGDKQTVGKFVVECGRLGEGGVQYHLSFSPEYIAAVNANMTAAFSGTGSSNSGTSNTGSTNTGVSNDAVSSSNTGTSNTGSQLHRCKRGTFCG